MSRHREDFNDHDEIYGGKEKKKKKKFRDSHGKNKVRDFKREFSQERDREDINQGFRFR